MRKGSVAKPVNLCTNLKNKFANKWKRKINNLLSCQGYLNLRGKKSCQ